MKARLLTLYFEELEDLSSEFQYLGPLWYQVPEKRLLQARIGIVETGTRITGSGAVQVGSGDSAPGWCPSIPGSAG